MWVDAKLLSKLGELFLELRSGICASHWPFHAQAQCNLFEFFAVLVFAIVHGMDKLMHKRVEDLDGLMQRRGNENLILVIGAALSRPALPDVMTASASNGEPAGDHDIFRDDMVFCQKDWTE
jgi:hypothetical protein